MVDRSGQCSRHTSTWIAAAIAALVPALSANAWSQVARTPSASKNESVVPTRGPLDGQRFKVRIVRATNDEVKQGGLGDVLIFRKGKFSSAICKKYNFKEAPYWVRSEHGKMHFFAELNSPTDGRMVWTGTVEKGVLLGTMHWTKKRWYWTIDANHRIRGALVTGANTRKEQ